MRALLALGLLCLLAAGARADDPPAAPSAPELFGVELCVDDLAAATAFWRDAAGFVIEQDVTPQAGVVLARDGLRVWLRPCTAAPKDGVTPILELNADDVQARQRTEAAATHDRSEPSLRWVHEDGRPEGGLDVSLDLLDPAAARDAVARLGFATARFVLRPRAEAAARGPESRELSIPATRRGAILLAVPDLAAAAAALRAAGADVIGDRPAPTTLGLSLAVRGPEGALFRVIERSPAVLAFERLRSMTGHWRASSTVGWVEDMRIDVIAGGSAVMEQAEGAHPGETMLTVWSMDGSRLLLTHYCVSLAHTRLVAARFEDGGATIGFDFLDATNLASRDVGHMDSIVYHFEGPDRFRSQWSWYQDGQSQLFEEITAERLP